MTETKIIKLSANENCYGCSPKTLLAIEKNYKKDLKNNLKKIT